MANQHFLKPLLPGFHSHLTIPLAFFLKNIEGKNKKNTAELRSDTSEITWKVKIDGQRLTDGWKEFALAHDLRIGDILVFKQERFTAFHVTLFGPSCCEIQYGLCLDDPNNIGKIQKKKNVRKNPRRKAESSPDPTCFVANVTPANLRYDSLTLPVSFVRENGVDTSFGGIILMNENGSSWNLVLKRKICGITYMRRGWRNFCLANGLSAGDSFTFKLIRRGDTLVLRFSSTEPEEEGCSTESIEIESLSTESDNDEDRDQDKIFSPECTKRKERKASSSPSLNRFVTIILTHYNIRSSTIVLPIPFTKVNVIKRAKKISLLDKHGVKWSTNLLVEAAHKRMRLVGGWKEFCDANGVKIGESIMMELIWEADKDFVLKFYSKVMPQPN